MKPRLVEVTKDEIEGISALLMSGSGGGSVTYNPIDFLINHSSLLGIGHSAVLFESSSGGLSLYNFSPRDNSTDKSLGAIARISNGYDAASYANFAAACHNNGVYITNGYFSWYEKFTGKIRLSVPYSNWSSAKAQAETVAANPPQYDVFSYNCMDFTLAILRSAGITLCGPNGNALYAKPSTPSYYYDAATSALGSALFQKGSV